MFMRHAHHFIFPTAKSPQKPPTGPGLLNTNLMQQFAGQRSEHKDSKKSTAVFKLEFRHLQEKIASEQLTIEDFNMNSARGPIRKDIVKPMEKQRLNKSVDDDETDVLNFSEGQFFHESHLQELGCGCQCQISGDNPKYCSNSSKWLDLAYNLQGKFNYEVYKKMYESFLISAPKLKHLRQSIQRDVERTFTQTQFFAKQETQDALIRILIAYAHYEPVISYVQGMNFIAAGLLYHSGEVSTFWLLIALMDQYGLKEIFKQNLPGLSKHEQALEKLGEYHLKDIFKHFVSLFE